MIKFFFDVNVSYYFNNIIVIEFDRVSLCISDTELTIKNITAVF